jgi:hypothetical protein
MTAAPAIADDHAQWAEALLRRQAELVVELSQGAARMAAAIEAKAGPEPAKSDAMAYARLFRTVRMGSLLLTRLVQEIGKVRSGERFEAPRREREALIAKALADPAHDHKSRVEHIVERIAEAEHGDDEDQIDRLVAECGERLDDEDIWRDVRALPVRDLVQTICKDLGLDPRPFLHEAWAMEEQNLTRPPPLAGEGVSSVATNDLVAMRTPAEERAGEVVERARCAATPEPWRCAPPS